MAPYAEFPAKGRSTAGVRCHRFLKGEDMLVLAFAGNTPVRAAAGSGVPIELPEADGRRDGSGLPAKQVITHVVAALPAADETDGPPPAEPS